MRIHKSIKPASLNSGDYVDLKAYEPAMRHLIDTYIQAEESEKISAFDNLSVIELIVERGPEAADARLKPVMKTEEAVAETIENNVRKIITNESPADPAYYEEMSKLLDALIEQRRKGVLGYKEYLAKIAELSKKLKNPDGGPDAHPGSLKTAAQRVLYNNLGKNEILALAVGAAVLGSRMDGWRDNAMKAKRVRNAIRAVLEQAPGVEAMGVKEEGGAYSLEAETARILELAKHQHEY